jgi:ethanolamine utilization protein EutN
MLLGKVKGNITSVTKIDELRPVRLYVVQLLDGDLELADDYIVAIDSIGVGMDDTVVITGGSGSRFTEITGPTHTDASIVARIDKPEDLKG